MDIYLTQLGCRLNEAEAESWARDLHARGHRVLAAPEGAELVILNTCSVTQEAGRKSRQLARRLHRANPSARLVLTGCWSSLAPELAAGLPGVDLVVPNRDKDHLVARVEAHLPPAAPAAPAHPHLRLPPSRTRAFIKIQDGCRNRCAFCIVTVARGDERSRAPEEVCDEIQRLADQGVAEVVLTGVHIGGYGGEIGVDLRHLLAAILERTSIPRLRVGSLEPWDLPSAFFDLWENPRLCPHLHLPLQSGSDAVLRRMSRRTTVASFRALVEQARASIRGLNLTTDLIVGFPGETDAEWQETLDTARAIGFGHIHSFTFSPHPGTRAARLPDPVPAHTQHARSQQLHALAAELKAEHLAGQLGQTFPVLWEGVGIPLAEGGWRWSGYTPAFLRVWADLDTDADLRGAVSPVRITGVVGGEALEGVAAL